jgi:hypothetical protein
MRPSEYSTSEPLIFGRGLIPGQAGLHFVRTTEAFLETNFSISIQVFFNYDSESVERNRMPEQVLRRTLSDYGTSRLRFRVSGGSRLVPESYLGNQIVPERNSSVQISMQILINQD